jgi:hypothetical protein
MELYGGRGWSTAVARCDREIESWWSRSRD